MELFLLLNFVVLPLGPSRRGHCCAPPLTEPSVRD